MPTPRRVEWLGTYFVPNNEKKEELARLTIEDEMFTSGMGGPLAEQIDPGALRDVLDIACGTGGWAIRAAAEYPVISVIGIDVCPDIIQIAKARAVTEKSGPQVAFQMMDALDPLQFMDASFDLVNMRLGSTFIRIWDWPALLKEILRVLRPGGILRLTEVELAQQSPSLAHARFFELLLIAEFNAGRLFERTSDGLTAHLVRLLNNYGLQNVQKRVYPFVFETGTPAGQVYYDYLSHCRTILPFLQKWGSRQQDAEAIFLQALADIQQSGFRVTWDVHTVWGKRF